MDIKNKTTELGLLEDKVLSDGALKVRVLNKDSNFSASLQRLSWTPDLVSETAAALQLNP